MMAGLTGRLGLQRGTQRRDVAIAAAGFTGGLVMAALGGYRGILRTPAGPGWLFLVPLGVVCAALLLRRTAPPASLGLGAAGLVADLALGGSLATILLFTQVLYDACGYGPPWLWRWLLRASVGLTAAGVVIGLAWSGGWRGLGVGIPLALGLVLPVVSGISVRQYRDQAALERSRAEQTARLAELDRRRAVADERNRMARELHDVIANHLSAVAIHATAALSVTGLDDAAIARTLTVIRENSVQGLAEMRRLVGLLRDPATPSLTRPGLAEVDRLVEQARSGGLEVGVRVRGEAGPLPVGVDLAAYRILQESLTNALKHGCGPAEVELHYGSGYLAVTVDNPVAAGSPTVPGAGVGLIGMRERADLLDGSFTAGRADGRWRVRARFPTGLPA